MQKVQKVLFTELTIDGAPDNSQIEELLSPLPIIRDHFNSKWFGKRYEINNEPSLTIPDEAMSISEMVARFANGIPLDGGREPLYDGEEELTDLEKLDLSERQAILEEARQRIAEAETSVKKRREEAEQKRLDDLVEQRVKLRLEEQQAAKPNNPI
jgi:hypothetical protein